MRGRSTRPNRSSPCARSGSPYPCPPHRQTGHRAHGAPGAYWCQPDRCSRSARRRPACGADKPATPGSSTPSSCPPGCSAGHAAPRSRSARRSRSTIVSGSRGGGPQCLLFLHCWPSGFDCNAAGQAQCRVRRGSSLRQTHAPEPAPRSRVDQTSCRKDQQPSRLQAAKNQASW